MQFALLQGATQGSGLTDRLWLDTSWRRPTISLWDYPSAVKTADWMGQEVLEERPPSRGAVPLLLQVSVPISPPLISSTSISSPLPPQHLF
jgi:hypothetical protein